MKISDISINPIGLPQDFNDLFELVLRSDTSSDNLFQQYQLDRDACKIHFDDIDSALSNSFDLFNAKWGTFSTKNNVVPLSNEVFISQYKDIFFQTLLKSPVNNGEDTEATIMFSELISQNKITTLYMLNDLFIKNIDNEYVCVKLLSLCNDYSYEELNPTAQTLAALSIHHKSSRVKSAAMNLFSHWGNKESYKLICSIDCPNEPWIKMKYQTIKMALKKKWCMQER